MTASDLDVARALARSPLGLLAWVLTALVPADLLGPNSRALVIRALVDFSRAVQGALAAKVAPAERAAFEGFEVRARGAFTALGEDPRALSDETLPAPTATIDGPTVARVIFAFAHELEQRGIGGAALLPSTLDKALCDRLATRASAIEPPSPDAKTGKAPRKPKRSA